MRFSTLLWCAVALAVPADVTGQCQPCADETEDFLELCTTPDIKEVAAALDSGSPECLSLQLANFQDGGCCPSPPLFFCTLCENGSENYNAAKEIPAKDGTHQGTVDCGDLASTDRWVRDVEVRGQCNATERAQSRFWCECEGSEAPCTLLCDDGNPPPDMNKADTIFHKTCERWSFEYSMLTADQCADPIDHLDFDAKAFCCNEEPPENCSICNEGSSIPDLEKSVRTEQHGNATCGEIENYAQYKPNGSCKPFIRELMGMPTHAASVCCESGVSNVVLSTGSALVTLSVLFSMFL